MRITKRLISHVRAIERFAADALNCVRVKRARGVIAIISSVTNQFHVIDASFAIAAFIYGHAERWHLLMTHTTRPRRDIVT